MAKLVASEAALENATEAMRIHGAYGYSTEDHVERYYRDAPLLCIGEGTNEIQRITIARQLVSRSNADPPEPVLRARRPLHLLGLRLHDGFGAPAHVVRPRPARRSACVALLALLALAALLLGGAFGDRSETVASRGPRRHRRGGRRTRPRGLRPSTPSASNRRRAPAASRFAVLAAAALIAAWAFQRLRFARAGRPRTLRIVGLPPGRAPPALRIV